MIQFTQISDIQHILEDLLTPHHFADAVEDIDPNDLIEDGIKTVLIDVDNTLLTYEEKEVSLGKIKWIETLKESGLSLFLISNNSGKKRILKVCRQLEVHGIFFACKPFPFSCRDLANYHQFNLEDSVIIGDQLLKDVLLGNWTGMSTILVNPIDIRRSFLKTMQRDVELWILKKLQGI